MTTWDPGGEFDALARDLLAQSDVEAGTGFGGSPGVRVGGRIFAMLVRARLVVKLPAPRCAELRDAGVAQPLAVGARVMKEWVEILPEDADLWRELADEAYGFVGAR